MSEQITPPSSRPNSFQVAEVAPVNSSDPKLPLMVPTDEFGFESQPIVTQKEVVSRSFSKLFSRRRAKRATLANTSSIVDGINDNSEAPSPELNRDDATESESESYKTLSELLSPGTLMARKDSLIEQINSSPALSAMQQLRKDAKANAEQWHKANIAQDLDVLSRLDKEDKELFNSEEALGKEIKMRYDSLYGQISALEVSQSYDVKATSENGRALVSLLRKAPPLQANPTQPAPFKPHESNDESSWKVVTNDEIKDYLRGRLPLLSQLPTKDGAITVYGSSDETFDVPSNLIIGLAGFDTWMGRSPRYGKDFNSPYGSGNMSSLNVIKHYASLPSEVPPVGRLRVLIQPDGKILCDNGAGDSHRIAAAIIRGDTTIKAKTLEFKLLESNII